MRHEALTDQVICCFYTVYNKLGYGFLERVYENALLIELQKAGIPAQSQFPICVQYENQTVGEYFADVLVDDKIIIEIKATTTLAPGHEAQLINYLKATNIEVGLLLNFGPKAEIKRKVFNNGLNPKD